MNVGGGDDAEELGPVARKLCDGIAGNQPQSVEHRDGAADPLAHLAIGETRLVLDEGDAVAVALDGGDNRLAERCGVVDGFVHAPPHAFASTVTAATASSPS